MDKILKQEPDLKEVPEETEEDQESKDFQERWQNSEFYPYVMNAIDNELLTNEVEFQMESRYAKGEQMNNDEIGEATRAEFMSKIRLKRVRDVLS